MMGQQFKQRVVGIIVLTALAVIFLPLLFEDAVDERPTLDLEIPEKPAGFESQVVALPEYPITSVAAHAPDEPRTAEVSAAPAVSAGGTGRIEEPEAPQDDGRQPIKTVPEGLSAWVIQMGSFSQESNAQGFSDQVQEKGYPSFVEKVPGRDGKPLYRVLVGPEIDRDKAAAMDKKLASTFHVKTLMMTYGG